jgi:hypothetical protein
MTEGRDGRAAWSDVRTRAIEGRGMRVRDMSDAKALKIANRSKEKRGKRVCGPNNRGKWLTLRWDGEKREEEFQGGKKG